MDDMKKVTDNHWKWVKGLMDTLPIRNLLSIESMEYLYKTAFEHGWKHALKSNSRTIVSKRKL